jgi:hypothetical protein
MPIVSATFLSPPSRSVFKMAGDSYCAEISYQCSIRTHVSEWFVSVVRDSGVAVSVRACTFPWMSCSHGTDTDLPVGGNGVQIPYLDTDDTEAGQS